MSRARRPKWASALLAGALVALLAAQPPGPVHGRAGPTPLGPPMGWRAGTEGGAPRAALAPRAVASPSTVPVAAAGNSSPVPEPLSVIGTIHTATPPVGAAYDPASGDLYVTRERFAGVSVYHDERFLADVPLGFDPGPLADDPANGFVYVVDVCGGAASGGCNATHHPNGTVAVLNGTTVLAFVPVGIDPIGIAVDPSTGLVYVACRNSSTLSLLRGSGLAKTYYLPAGAQAEVFDPLDRSLYVADPGAGSILRYGPNGSIGAINDSNDPVALAFDAAQGEVDVADAGTNAVDWLDGSSIVGSLRLPLSTTGRLFFDPGNGLLYASGTVLTSNGPSIASCSVVPGGSMDRCGLWYEGFGSGLYLPANARVLLTNFTGPAGNPGPPSLTEYATLLAADPLQSVTNGTLPGAVDVGSTFNLTDWLWATGAGATVANLTLEPADGIRCGVVIPGPPGPNQSFNASCLAYAAGSYYAAISVTDADNSTVLAWTYLYVSLQPIAGPPGFTIANTTYAGAAYRLSPGPDAGEPFVLDAATSGGNGPYEYEWSGLLAANCSMVQSSHPRCVFGEPGDFTIALSFRDLGSGWNASGPSTTLVVYPALTLAPPTFSAYALPAGATVSGSVEEAGGLAPFVYYWVGLPDGCTITGARVSCTPGSPGVYHVRVETVDGNTFAAESPVVVLTVAARSAPGLPTLWAWTLLAASVGALVLISAGVVIRRRAPAAPPSAPLAARAAPVYRSEVAPGAGRYGPPSPDGGPEPWSEAESDGEAPPWD